MLFKNTNVNKLYQAIIWACLACFGFNSLGYSYIPGNPNDATCAEVEMSLAHLFSEEHVKIKVGPGITTNPSGNPVIGYRGIRLIEATVVDVTDPCTRVLNNFYGFFQKTYKRHCEAPLDLANKFEDYKKNHSSSLKKGDTIYVQYEFVTIQRINGENVHYLYEDKTYQVYLNKGKDNVYHLHKNSRGESWNNVYKDRISGHDMWAFKK